MEPNETTQLLGTSNKENERIELHDFASLKHKASQPINQQVTTQTKRKFSSFQNGIVMVDLTISDISQLQELLVLVRKTREELKLQPAVTLNLKLMNPTDYSGLLNLSQLFYLDLTGCELKELPAKVAALSQLRGLILDDNNIRFKYTDFKKMTELTRLSVSNNKITELPRDLLAPLQKLHTVNFANNPLKTFLINMAKVNLKEVNLDNTRIPEDEKTLIKLLCLFPRKKLMQ